MSEKIEKYYSQKRIKELENAVTRKVNSILEQLVQILSNDIYISPNKNITSNLLLRQRIQDLRSKLTSDMKSIVSAYMLKGQELANIKNEKVIEQFTKNIVVPEGIKQAWKFDIQGVDLRKLSGKIWKLSEDYFSMIELTLNAGMYDGISAVEIAKDLRKLLNNPNNLNINELRRLGIENAGGLRKYREIEKKILNYKPGRGIYKSAKKNALRLARNEINIAYRRQDQQNREKLEFVVGQTVKLSASHPREDMCDFLQGDYNKNFQFTGWHPQCICYVVNKTVSKEEFKEFLTTGEIKTPQTVGIPNSAKTWIKDNSEYLTKTKNKPYWIDDNFKNDLNLKKGL